MLNNLIIILLILIIINIIYLYLIKIKESFTSADAQQFQAFQQYKSNPDYTSDMQKYGASKQYKDPPKEFIQTSSDSEQEPEPIPYIEQGKQYVNERGKEYLISDQETCKKDDSTITYDDKKWCYHKNKYKDTSMIFSEAYNCLINSGDNRIVGYNGKNFTEGEAFDIMPTTPPINIKCKPQSIKVFLETKKKYYDKYPF